METVESWQNVINHIPKEKKELFSDLEYTLKHIFTSDTNGGYHSEFLYPAQNNLKIEKSFENGVYQGRFDGKYSSFFPKTWDVGKVISEIVSAYENQYISLYQIYGFPKVGKSLSGVYVAIETSNGKIKNAYPAPRQEGKYHEKNGIK